MLSSAQGYLDKEKPHASVFNTGGLWLYYAGSIKCFAFANYFTGNEIGGQFWKFVYQN
jgi:hypothetical protein